MATTSTQVRPAFGGLAPPPNSRTIMIVLRYLGLMVLNAMALIIIISLIRDDNLGLGAVFIVITLFANIVTFVPGLYPIRWMAPGFMLITLLVIYPILYTIVTAFTNYGDGHLLTKEQSIDLIEERVFVPENASTYSWEVYQNEEGTYALWLVADTPNADGDIETVWAVSGQPIEEVDSPPAEPPASYEEFTMLDRAGRAQALSVLQNEVFGEGDDTAQILSRRQVARPLVQRYVYDDSADTITDQQTGRVYVADGERGFFVPQDGSAADALAPGYRVGVGLDNFRRLIENERLRGPLVDIFIWTITFSLLSVLTTFSLGLFVAIILNDPSVPGRKIIQSLLIIPYAIPGIIAILIWKGLFNQELGLINSVLGDARVTWFANPWWAKFTIILVNLWLGYPYMMLISSGALQSIPSDVYEAAAVDGSRPWQTFWRITLPLLLITVGPLLIASFTFNFNNYLLIEALTEGNPVIQGSPVPAGHTDILITYTYDQAFGNSRGADYGYASAITLIIFIIVAVITLFNFRFTRSWEAMAENV